MSGKASLAKNLEMLGIQLVEENLNKVLSRVVELGDTKKSMTAADLPIIIADVLETSDSQRIELLNCSISSGLNLRATATIHLKIDSKEFLETGSGNGGYDAFMSAVKKILKNLKLKAPELVDYQIRIPRGGKSNALTEAMKKGKSIVVRKVVKKNKKRVVSKKTKTNVHKIRRSKRVSRFSK